MSLITPTCMYCRKEIGKDEEALVVVPYPKRKGFTEIKAYLDLEGKFICMDCTKREDLAGFQ
ncbi:Fe3+ hydroxamate ABC transporter substrate-binding protein [Planomicrobium sp. YIM 101495]|uniref:Fe3+ hydroxamate ABC transporter substrate-binding protein n=1 Tax=Planomicrobium sp. YIM 101495 TaxID=2665160 RepID=UPI0012B80001|nr:Fe3+ hydroxamate ABC transporter substrate-binding protein [Planomicrobium sp. YIM 101495]MTD31271.1 Fe3+ hydroxamate ABC transporter substrate-binding protein [Planomicrobium sp. YIM 101495]